MLQHTTLGLIEEACDREPHRAELPPPSARHHLLAAPFGSQRTTESEPFTRPDRPGLKSLFCSASPRDLLLLLLCSIPIPNTLPRCGGPSSGEPDIRSATGAPAVMRLLSLVAAGLALLGAASAQAPPVTQNGATSMTAVPTAATTRFVTVQVITSTLGQNSSSMASATSSTGSMSVVNATSTAAASTTAEAAVRLDTHIDPAFGILGALLILSGLAIAITGSAHKRWSDFQP